MSVYAIALDVPCSTERMHVIRKKCCAVIRRYLRFGWSNHNVSKGHPALLARLKTNGARQTFMAVKSASRDPRNILMVDDRYTVLYDGNVPPD